MEKQTAAPVVFLDTETISLQRDWRHVWEIGMITAEGDEYHVFLNVPLAEADPIALNIGGFHERHPTQGFHTTHEYRKDKKYSVCVHKEVAEWVARFTWGKHLVGAVPSFDEERVNGLLRANGQIPGWHYHLVDIEVMIVGYLASKAKIDARPDLLDLATPPYRSEDLSRAIGVDPDQFERHTALGDCRWNKAMYDAVLGHE